MRKMVDSKGKEILVHKNDFADALILGYMPKHTRVVIHDPIKWANRHVGQSLADLGLFYIDIIPGAKNANKAIEKVIDLLQNQKCELGYPKGFHADRSLANS